ncbi:MAG TPA: TetR/AcrR family transcriptional regulator [Candidatus Cryptobacteroides sp.]|nr:TetR/AcrR family transcriptional regulator [Candidatus Cryptobacteroides sp.]
MTKEQQILLAAEEEFLKNGYDATSTAVIARKVGVTHAMVNYYYRNKKQLFLKVLDVCTVELLEKIKVLMRVDGNFVELAANTSAILFDSFLAKRRLPFLLLDVARTHPEFLEHYREVVGTVCAESIKRHSVYLEQQILEGKVADCTINDVFNTVMSLALAPFLNAPMLENVLGMSEEEIEAYLKAHRAEMLKIIYARYSGTQK